MAIVGTDQSMTEPVTLVVPMLGVTLPGLRVRVGGS